MLGQGVGGCSADRQICPYVRLSVQYVYKHYSNVTDRQQQRTGISIQFELSHIITRGSPSLALSLLYRHSERAVWEL